MMEIKQYLQHLNQYARFRSQRLEEYTVFLQSIESESKALQDVRKQYGDLERDTFNFFEPIKNYWREDFHDIMLSIILDPHTKEIGNSEYLRIFYGVLKTINQDIPEYPFENSVTVERQVGDKTSGYIDMLIFDDIYAVIFESKINGASDQPDQLARYFEYVEEKRHKKVAAVVYIRPFGDENKSPPFETYSEETKNKINAVLVCLSAVDSKTQKDICHGFLDRCAEVSKNIKAHIFIQQYSDLLKILGGNKMIESYEKDLFKKLCEKEDWIKYTSEIAGLWERRWEILAAIIHEALRKRGFVLDPYGNNEHYTYKSITETVDITFIYNPPHFNWNHLFGFYYKSKKEIKTLKDILGEFGGTEPLTPDVEVLEDWFVVKRFTFNLDKPVDQIIETVASMYERLEERVKAALT